MIILPENYHAQRALENNRVICITAKTAFKANIRPLRIGILNIMPEAKSYEFSLLQPLGRSVLQIIPVWIKLHSHKYKSTASHHLKDLYVTFEQAIKQELLDGMIVTGAPVEKLPFDQITYWNEIKDILLYSQKEVPSTLGICWGGMALAFLLGIEKENYATKHFGIYETINLQRNHHVTGSLDDIFWLPHSRHAGFSNQVIEQARDFGIINLLAQTVNLDYPIFESHDQRFLINLGHFEYSTVRIIEEYKRDHQEQNQANGPENFDIRRPINRWRGQRNEFFQQWLNFCHEETHKQNVSTIKS
ncbi:MAG: homoserine O-succinyltransferase [SAR324 cluster bacterium]|nr:homoserine O-succinyltransferase [SAR324 cluster bacterium]